MCVRINSTARLIHLFFFLAHNHEIRCQSFLSSGCNALLSVYVFGCRWKQPLLVCDTWCWHLIFLLPGVTSKSRRSSRSRRISSSSGSSGWGPENSPTFREESPTTSSGRNHEDKSCIRTRIHQPVSRGRRRGGWNRERPLRNLSVLMDGLDDDTSPDFLPNKKTLYNVRVHHKDAQQQQEQQELQRVYTQPDQKLRGTSSTFTNHQEASGCFHQTTFTPAAPTRSYMLLLTKLQDRLVLK